MKGPFINPFTDIGFKRIFGSEDSKSVVIDMLNAIIGDENRIESIEFNDKEQPPVSGDGRTVIYDIYCQTQDGRRIIVEMQSEKQRFFRKRTLYYAARSISRQGKKGERKYDFDAVYVVSFLRFTDPGISDSIRSDIMLMDVKTKRVFTDAVRFIYVQMPLAKKTEAECENDFDYWIYTLNNMETLEKMPFTDKNPAFVDLIDLATYDKMTEDEQIAYDRSLKRMWDYEAVMDYARETAHEAGVAEGMKKGKAEGHHDVAINMKKLGFDIDTIAQATGLSEADIKAL